ncbi:MAG: hypothetical protein K2J70_07480 [Muribaculaceae bacterium]|nr:hypothetical protein [Muribaculaceae bacterium]
MIRKILLSVLLLISGVSFLHANKVDDIEAKLNRELASTKSPEDSIRILFDLFDLVPRKEKIKYSAMLYDVAGRQKRTDVQLDLLRQLSQLTSSVENRDSAFRRLNDEVAKLPRSREQEETALFIRMRQVSGEAREASSERCEVKIAQLIAEESKAPGMPMNFRVLRLFTIVEYLTNSGVEGNLLGEYVGMLRERMKNADFKLYALNNALLTESANIYTTIGDPEQAVKSDKELLKVVEQLEKKYHEDGRKYRNYIPNKYIIYRRMLGNFPALTPEEVEDYYRKIKQYASEDEDVANAEAKSTLTELYYAMATKNYIRALPIIRERLKTEQQPAKRRRLVRWLQTAAEGVGDKDGQIEALKLYNEMLIERDTSSSSDRAKELGIRTRVNELKADKAQLQIEKEKEEKDNYRRMMSLVMAGFLLIGILLIVLLFYWGRYRSASYRISEFVGNLSDEVNYLKRQYYDDYSDRTGRRDNSVDNTKAHKMVRRRKRENSIMAKINYILNDLLYISSIGKIGRGKFIRPVSVMEVLEDETARARSLQTSGSSLEVILPKEDIEIRTDKECLEYVVRHLFFAANRVADGGEIILELRESGEGHRVDFLFTNTSVCVPAGNEDVMFDNFIDVDKMVDRDDSGLFIARLNAFLIDSNLYLDSEFKDGSRYVFSVSRYMGR